MVKKCFWRPTSSVLKQSNRVVFTAHFLMHRSSYRDCFRLISTLLQDLADPWRSETGIKHRLDVNILEESSHKVDGYSSYVHLLSSL